MAGNMSGDVTAQQVDQDTGGVKPLAPPVCITTCTPRPAVVGIGLDKSNIQVKNARWVLWTEVHRAEANALQSH